MNNLKVTSIKVTDKEITIVRMPPFEEGEVVACGVRERYKLDENVAIDIDKNTFSEEEALLILNGIKCSLDESRIDNENNRKYINILRKFERDYPKSAEIQEEVQWMIEYFN